jgi:hypothetical protein
MSLEEVNAVIASARAEDKLPNPRAALDVTGGVPLQLRQLILSNNVSTQNVWSNLPPTAREIATYITLSPLALSIADILRLRGDPSYGPEHLIDDLDRMPSLIISTGAGYSHPVR